MIRRLSRLMVVLLTAAFVAATTSDAAETAPPLSSKNASRHNASLKTVTPIVFDTDITGDCDDVLALAMLHALADRGECDIRAITISKKIR